jgi:transposase InsO family protein
LPHTVDRYEPSHPGRLIHADIVGPFISSKVGRFQYALVLVDDHTRFKMLYLLRHKSEAVAAVKQFVASFNAYASAGKRAPVRVVGTLHTDNAGEFLSREMSELLDDNGVARTTCPAYVHELNGVAERAIRSVFELTRAYLTASRAPKSFWPYAAQHAVDVLNRCTAPPTRAFRPSNP